MVLSIIWDVNFNSHVHEGRDDIYLSRLIAVLISTHTSTRDVTSINSTQVTQDFISTHTSTRDVTKALKTADEQVKISTHTSTRDVTLLPLNSKP